MDDCNCLPSPPLFLQAHAQCCFKGKHLHRIAVAATGVFSTGSACLIVAPVCAKDQIIGETGHRSCWLNFVLLNKVSQRLSFHGRSGGASRQGGMINPDGRQSRINLVHPGRPLTNRPRMARTKTQRRKIQHQGSIWVKKKS